ncbi:MAG TPA: pentapeptide repeat-containing protein, partial [bacterium]|nr:pentapeptide repeat-containing protein [bacterium]
QANLQGAILAQTNLQRAILRKANLQGANLRKANLKGAFLRETNLQGAKYSEKTIPPRDSFNFKERGMILTDSMGFPMPETSEPAAPDTEPADEEAAALAPDENDEE